MLSAILQFQKNQQSRFIEELFALLRIPSISAQQTHKTDCERCAKAVAQALQQAGAHAKIYPTKGHPIVYAETEIDASKPTILVYGHYDVQPVDPVSLWKTPPFEPQIRAGKIYARGSADDKGQMFMHIKALESMTQAGALPVNLKFVIEGEEEVGSASLLTFLKANKKLLKSDLVLVSDTAMIAWNAPSIDTGLRGIASLEVEVRGANRDLHSGVYGGAVANPITALCELIASLHDKNHRVAVKGFYDKVQALSASERKALARAPFNLTAYKKDLGIQEDWGDAKYTTMERVSVRPTLELNGIIGGYTEEGSKTVLPSKASAKITCRLVPNQNYEEIERLVRTHLEAHKPAGVRLKITTGHGAMPYVMPVDNLAYKAAERAVQQSMKKKPVPVRGGGSIPIVADFEKYLGVKTLLLGFGLNDDNLHAPNEKFDVRNFYKGIETITRFHFHYAAMLKEKKKIKNKK